MAYIKSLLTSERGSCFAAAAVAPSLNSSSSRKIEGLIQRSPLKKGLLLLLLLLLLFFPTCYFSVCVVCVCVCSRAALHVKNRDSNLNSIFFSQV